MVEIKLNPQKVSIPDRKLSPEAEAKVKRTEHKLTPEEKATLDANLKKLGIEKIGKGMS